MKALITGASGLLGKSLKEIVPKGSKWGIDQTYNKNWPLRAAGIWYRLDIKSRSDVFETFEISKPNIVIHCASIGSVDYTENHYRDVRDVNVGGLGHIIDACNGYKAKLIYISTNAVFSGKEPPYDENSPLEPVNSYGVIKREAERLVRDKADKWLIIRPFMLYGWPYSGGRTNWAVKIIETLSQGNSQKLVDDVIWMPTYALDCAETIWCLATKEVDKEIFNVAAPERVTLYKFGLQVCDIFNLDKRLLEPAKTDEFRSIAKRPVDTTYDLVKLNDYGFTLSDVKTGLEKMRMENE